MSKFTFRRQPRQTGLAGVAQPQPPVDIKLNGKIVGVITPPDFRDTTHSWRVCFMIKDQEQPGGWRWIRLVGKFADEQSARQFVKDKSQTLQSRYDFAPQDVQ